MLTNLKAAVIGLGVGEAHLRSYQAIDGVEVASICDIDPQRLTEIGDRYGVSSRYKDFERITEDPDIDVISICSYDDAHAEQLVSALRHGKHVMIEKPFVLHKREAERVLHALEDSGKMMSSNLILRASPRFKEVRDMVRRGDFGEVFYMEGDYLHDILWKITEGWRGKMDFHCTFYGGGIHLVDLMRWIIGQDVTEVTAMGTDILVKNSDYRFVDTIVALMQFSGGAIAKCATTFGPRRPKFHALSVYGTKLSFENDVPEGKLFSSDDPADEKKVTSLYPGMEKGDLLPEFIDAIRSGNKPTVNEVDIFRVMDVCFAVWDSVQTGKNTKVDYLI